MSRMFHVFSDERTCRREHIEVTGETIEIRYSVGAGGINQRDDVRTIQGALNRVPALQGGPLPPLDVDGWAGPLTIGAIKKFQRTRCDYPWPDGRVDPGHRTISRLRDAIKESGQLTPQDHAVMTAVYAALEDARAWTHAARRSLHFAELTLRGHDFAVNPRHLELVHTYFHLDRVPEQQRLPEIAAIDRIFQHMQACILHTSPMTQLGTGYFQVMPLEIQHKGHMFAFPGGFHLTGRPRRMMYGSREDCIAVSTQRVLELVPRSIVVTRIVVHELAHFVGPRDGHPDHITDHAGLHKDPEAFERLTPYQARRNADSYCLFAGEAKLGSRTPLRI